MKNCADAECGFNLVGEFQGAGGLLRTLRRADENSRLLRQVLVQPACDFLGLFVATGGQPPLVVADRFIAVFGFCMAPEYQFHFCVLEVRGGEIARVHQALRRR